MSGGGGGRLAALRTEKCRKDLNTAWRVMRVQWRNRIDTHSMPCEGGAGGGGGGVGVGRGRWRQRSGGGSDRRHAKNSRRPSKSCACMPVHKQHHGRLCNKRPTALDSPTERQPMNPVRPWNPGRAVRGQGWQRCVLASSPSDLSHSVNAPSPPCRLHEPRQYHRLNRWTQRSTRVQQDREAAGQRAPAAWYAHENGSMLPRARPAKKLQKSLE